ncbi:ribonuclease H-like domain-containing protein [Penicillium maclennaniae]|uniref:ribonuclease H-like domain-containing protein n=1 Tax=Penicillium maclennaniae TaxID=1343394 RepID=UPI00253FC2BB|nr:ribonuclease H-like domain-containing protein [Penicillium maclennaniae]KAJ5662557.1 ribonuclease H-like domain-containing protein [Penicillium maclennaniae]
MSFAIVNLSPGHHVHSTPCLRTNPPHVEPVPENEQAVLDISGMTISWSKLKTLGYQITLFLDSEIRRMLRCSDCLLRVKSKAQRSKEMPHWAVFNGVVPPLPEKAICQSHPLGPRNKVNLPYPRPDLNKLYADHSQKFQCCGAKVGQSSSGCVQKDTHGTLFGFEELKKDYFMHGTERGVAIDERHAVALDCEMGISITGESELIQVAAIDFFSGEILLDSLVWPDVKMRHLSSRHSGITWPMMHKAAKTNTCIWGRDEARKRLMRFVGTQTVIIAHDGKHDLLALRWRHSLIVDTKELETRMGSVGVVSKSPNLKNLTHVHLKREVQQGQGHDCLEDCLATRDLAAFFLKTLPASEKITEYERHRRQKEQEDCTRLASGLTLADLWRDDDDAPSGFVPWDMGPNSTSDCGENYAFEGKAPGDSKPSADESMRADVPEGVVYWDLRPNPYADCEGDVYPDDWDQIFTRMSRDAFRAATPNSDTPTTPSSDAPIDPGRLEDPWGMKALATW